MAKSFLQPLAQQNSEDVRRMVAGWQAVEEREREERRQAEPDVAMAIRGALELMDLFGEMHGWPPPKTRPAAATMSWLGADGSVSAATTWPMAKRPSKRIVEAVADLAKRQQVERLEKDSEIYYLSLGATDREEDAIWAELSGRSLSSARVSGLKGGSIPRE